MNQKPIGVYDSGVGGLTVLNILRQQLPQENFVYFADTLNLPYGTKTPEQILSITQRILHWMQDVMDVKILVAACHTSSALSVDQLALEARIPVIGTIRPTVEAILQNPDHQRVGIIATPASVKSRTHERVLRDAGFTGHVTSIACPDFVPLIERGDLNNPLLLKSAEDYLRVFHTENLDTLIYGCTHYPWISKIVKQFVPSGTALVDPAHHISQQVTRILEERKLRTFSSESAEVIYYSSGAPDLIEGQIHNLMGNRPRVDYSDIHERNVNRQVAIG